MSKLRLLITDQCDKQCEVFGRTEDAIGPIVTRNEEEEK